MSKWKHWKSLLNGMTGPAAQWRDRIRRRLEHPDWKHIPPDYGEIQNLIEEVEALRVGLNECYREVYKHRLELTKAQTKVRQYARRMEKLASSMTAKI